MLENRSTINDTVRLEFPGTSVKLRAGKGRSAGELDAQSCNPEIDKQYKPKPVWELKH